MKNVLNAQDAGFDPGCFERFACRMPEMFRHARQMATKVAEYKTKRGYSADGTNPLRKR
ncbi:MAG TPA: hypothetical protein VK834_03250 [Bradyrhizobium sp.]|nr:hypothetical protein [Bradyrhizobium sp.]